MGLITVPDPQPGHRVAWKQEYFKLLKAYQALQKKLEPHTPTWRRMMQRVLR